MISFRLQGSNNWKKKNNNGNPNSKVISCHQFSSFTSHSWCRRRVDVTQSSVLGAILLFPFKKNLITPSPITHKIPLTNQHINLGQKKHLLKLHDWHLSCVLYQRKKKKEILFWHNFQICMQLTSSRAYKFICCSSEGTKSKVRILNSNVMHCWSDLDISALWSCVQKVPNQPDGGRTQLNFKSASHLSAVFFSQFH